MRPTPQNTRDLEVIVAEDGRTVVAGHDRISAMKDNGIAFIRVHGRLYDLAGWPSSTLEPVADPLLRTTRAVGVAGLSRGEIEHRLTVAIGIAIAEGPTDGAHHKMWVIDQMLRAMLGAAYEPWRATVPDWDEGIAP